MAVKPKIPKTPAELISFRKSQAKGARFELESRRNQRARLRAATRLKRGGIKAKVIKSSPGIQADVASKMSKRMKRK